jgi:hypothetical protein
MPCLHVPASKMLVRHAGGSPHIALQYAAEAASECHSLPGDFGMSIAGAECRFALCPQVVIN